MDAVAALRRHGGVASYRELLQLVERTELERSLSAGVIVRARRGVYALPAADEALAAAARIGGVVSHLSAALVHGWKVKKPPKTPVVTVARRRSGVASDGVDLHWGDITGQKRVTDPVRTVIDCARTLPYDEALAVADSALRSRKVSRAQLLAAAEKSPRTGRSRALNVVRTATSDAANPFESVLRAIAQEIPGLTVVPQGEIDDWTHPDLVDHALQIAIEADSFEYHSLPEAFAYDVRRYTGLVRAGWLVVRFTWEEVMHKPAYVRAVLTDVVALRAQQRAVPCTLGDPSACRAA